MDHQRRSTAVHEAGHAVIARALGIGCGEVTIIAEEGHSLGHSDILDPRFDWRRGDGPKGAAATKFVIALYAGAEAEQLICNSQYIGDSVDKERATACLAWAGVVRGAVFVGDDRFDRYEAKLRIKSASLVAKHRNDIECLAAALLEREKLSGQEVDALLAASPA